ncbi:MAG: hypothetical protein ACI8P7_000855 [Candidatus Azotimanducaceae bacterium]|jgi:hypothetical protein
MRLDKTILGSFFDSIPRIWMALFLLAILHLFSCSKNQDSPQGFGIQVLNPNTNRYFNIDQSFKIDVLFDLDNAKDKIDALSFSIVTESGGALGPSYLNNISWKGDTASRVVWLGDYELAAVCSAFVKVRASFNGVTRSAFREIFFNPLEKEKGWIELNALQSSAQISFFNFDTNYTVDQINSSLFAAEIDTDNNMLWLVTQNRNDLLLFDLFEARVLKEINITERVNVLEQQGSVLFVGTDKGFVYRYNSSGQLLGIMRLVNDPEHWNIKTLVPQDDELFVEAVHQFSGDTLQVQILIATGIELRTYHLESSLKGLFELDPNRYLLFQETGVFEFYSQSGLANLIHEASGLQAVEQISANTFAVLIGGDVWVYTFNNNSLVQISNTGNGRGLAFQNVNNVLAVLFENNVIYFSALDFSELLNRNTNNLIELLVN